jgi:peptide/nickel transport system permease protein
MRRFILGRLVQAAVTVLLMSGVVFGLVRLTGDPVDMMLSPYATDEKRAAASHELGLDRPLVTQYWLFLSGALRGDMGDSLYYKKSAVEVVVDRLWATAQLAVVALFLALLIAIPLGVLSAVRRDTVLDTGAKLFAVLGQAVPNFWLAILLIEFVGVRWRLLPTGGRGGFAHLVLPALALGWFVAAGIMRITRSAMLDVLAADFIRLVRAKGLPNWLVVWKHALKNALIPVATFSGLIFAQMLVGSIIVETVFAWPGIGRLAYQAVVQRDFPLLQTIVIAFTLIYILMNLAVDLLYAWIDPRVRAA